MADPEDPDPEETTEEREATPEDREILKGAASDSLAQMPGYDKLGQDQDNLLFQIEDRPPYPWSTPAIRATLKKAGVEEGKLGCFDSRADYFAWAHRVFVHSLGRRTKIRRLLFSQVLIPFMVRTERGESPAGVFWRSHLRTFITEEMFPGAQSQFSRKAREEPLVEVRYLAQPKASGSVYDQLAARRAEDERKEARAHGKR